MTEQVARLGLCIETDPKVEADELARLAVQLRQELLELDIESVEPATAGTPPPGARTGELLTAGALIVMLLRSPVLFELLIKTVQAWISRGGERSVELEINGDKLKLTGVSRRDQHEVIQWVERNTDR